MEEGCDGVLERDCHEVGYKGVRECLVIKKVVLS